MKTVDGERGKPQSFCGTADEQLEFGLEPTFVSTELGLHPV
jgi:hypothetical protein